MTATDEQGGGRFGARWLLGGIGLGLVVAAVAVWVITSVLASDEPPAAAGAPAFIEQAAAAGIDHVYDGEFTFFVGGGVAAFDCDDDLLPDIYIAGGANPASLYRNQSDLGGDLRFAAVASAAAELTDVVGAYPIDIDADAIVDLAVLRIGENVLLRGTGDCGFERANEQWGFDGGDEWTAAFSAMWEADAQRPTLAFGNYLDLDENRAPTWACEDNVLARPTAGGGYGSPTALSPGWCTLSILFTDWNRSGSPDLRIANDRHYYRDGEEQLWRIEAGAPPALYSTDDGWRSIQIWGMGIATQDVTGDGVPELYLTSQGDNKLQTLAVDADGPTYEDIAIRRGVTAHRPYAGGEILPSTAWHPEFQDVNNDGFVDLYVSKGNVEAMVEFAADDPNNLMLGQPDGTFVESAGDAGIVNYARTRGAALVDFNLDGLLDLVEVDRRENVKLWRNTGTSEAGNWFAVRLLQNGGNRDGVGAWLEVESGDSATVREFAIGGGHAGDQLGWIHFGIGDASSARLRVQWPDGEVGSWLDIEANTFAIIERGADRPEVWSP